MPVLSTRLPFRTPVWILVWRLETGLIPVVGDLEGFDEKWTPSSNDEYIRST